MKRAEILQRIIEEQNKVIQNLQESVDRYKSASDLDEDDTADPDDYARQTQAKDMQLRYEKMLVKEKNDLNFVLSEKETSHTEIETGSVVETENHYFFIGVALPAFKMESKEVFCISPEAPIFGKLRGKKTGDTIEMGSNTFKITSIF